MFVGEYEYRRLFVKYTIEVIKQHKKRIPINVHNWHLNSFAYIICMYVCIY